MNIHFFILTVLLSLLLSCEQSSIRKPQYQQFDNESCNSNIENRTADIEELRAIDSDNASSYNISGTCKRDNSEVRVYIEGHPLDISPVCNRGSWETSVDVTGIINKKERVQIAVSQAGSSGLHCQNTTNYFICPDGYIGVPELEHVSYKAFCVMKYEAKSSKALPSPHQRSIIKAEARAEGVPITRVNETDAIKYCEQNGPGYNLIKNEEWQTIARHIELTEVNWSKGNIKIENGNHLNVGNISGVKTSSNDNDINDKKWHKNKRTHKLLNGEYIWDFAGNLGEIVQNSISNLPTTYTGYIYSLPTQMKELFGPDRDYTILDDRERINGFGGLGFMQGNRFEGGLIRGGSNSRTAGIFSVDTSFSRDRLNFRGNVGFRCVYHP